MVRNLFTIDWTPATPAIPPIARLHWGIVELRWSHVNHGVGQRGGGGFVLVRGG